MSATSPALTHRAGDYPVRFNGAVPKTIIATETVQSEVYQYTLSPMDASLIVFRDRHYPAWVNSHGAVAAILPDGRKLGLKPHEFQVVEWHAINCCPKCVHPSGDGRICELCQRRDAA